MLPTMLLWGPLGIFAGLVAHLGFFIHGEWHMSIVQIIRTHLALAFALFYALSHVEESFSNMAHAFLAIAIWYFLSLFSSMSIYRLYFHAISAFPGPKLAAITKFWHVFHVRNSRNFLLMEDLHKKYGNFVRTGPNEISVFHPNVIKVLDAWNSDHTKDVWYDLMHPRSSVIFSRDEADHKKKRKAWTHALSPKAMDALRPRIVAQAESLSRCILHYDTKAVDVNEVMSWFSFDAMADVVFGKGFDLMNLRTMHPAIIHRDRALALIGPISDAIWIAFLAFSLIPFYGRVQDWFRMVAFCDDHMERRLQKGEGRDKIDLMAWFLHEYEDPKDTRGIEARKRLLSGSVVTAVVAGSDTVRASLITIWWFLSKYPEHAERIQSEIQDIDISDPNALALLQHLNGVINETFRLVPPALTGNGRITGPNGLLLDGTFIPPFTKVTAPKYVIQRMESAFDQPDKFIPERWYSRPELIREKQAFAPFSFGARQCVGKALAYTEIRLVIAILLQKYHVSFAPGYDPKVMWRDMKDQVTAQPGQLLCIFTPRQ